MSTARNNRRRKARARKKLKAWDQKLETRIFRALYDFWKVEWARKIYKRGPHAQKRARRALRPFPKPKRDLNPKPFSVLVTESEKPGVLDLEVTINHESVRGWYAC